MEIVCGSRSAELVTSRELCTRISYYIPPAIHEIDRNAYGRKSYAEARTAFYARERFFKV